MNYKKAESMIEKFQESDNLTKLIYIGAGVIVLILLKMILTAMIPIIIIGTVAFCLYSFVKKQNIQSKTKSFKRKKKTA